MTSAVELAKTVSLAFFLGGGFHQSEKFLLSKDDNKRKKLRDNITQ
jgi:hypothetical protein